MNWKGKQWKTFAACVCCVAVVVTGCSLFISSMNNMLKNNTLNTIHELAQHDLTSMENYLDENWNKLIGVRERMISYNCDTVLKAQERLNLECATTDFYAMCFVTEDGSVYNDRYMHYTADEMDLSAYGQGLEGPVVGRYDFSNNNEAQQKMLLFAIPLEGLHLSDARVASLIGLVKIQAISDKMNIAAFTKDGKSRGYSSVFDSDGTFIVNVEKNYQLNRRKNMFESLESGEISDGWTVDQVQSAMEQNETFDFSYTPVNGNLMQLYFQPVDHTDWYFVSIIDNTVFTDTSHTFVISSVSMVVISLGITIAMAVLLLNNRKKTMMDAASLDARTEFLSQMNHEVRTPLNGVIGLLHLIRSNINPAENEQVAQWVCQAEETADYLHSVVSSILDMSRLTNGKLKLNNRSFMLDQMIDSVCSLTASADSETPVNLILEKDILVPSIVGDKSRIQQILMALLNNAVKFSPAGSPIWLRVTQKPVDSHRVETIFSVQDTGTGISREFMHRMWEPFEQENVDLSSSGSGTGLGLAICRSLAKAMNARLEAESKIGEGSTFTLRLISKKGVVEDAEERKRRQNTVKVLDPAFSAGAKILVADENDTDREVLMHMLQEKGFEAVGARNGQEVLDLLSQSKPWEYDTILIEIHLPGLDGPEVAKAVRKASRTDIRTIPIFACSSSMLQSEKERALRAGMDDCIPKPIHPEELLDRINLYHQFKYTTVDPGDTRARVQPETKADDYSSLSPAQQAALERGNRSVRDLLGPESEAG